MQAYVDSKSGNIITIGMAYVPHDPPVDPNTPKMLMIPLAVLIGKCVDPYKGIVYIVVNADDGQVVSIHYKRNGLADFIKTYVPYHDCKVDVQAAAELFYLYLQENKRLFVSEFVTKQPATTPYDPLLVGKPIGSKTTVGFRDYPRLTPFVHNDPDQLAKLEAMKLNKALAVPPSVTTFMHLPSCKGEVAFDAVCWLPPYQFKGRDPGASSFFRGTVADLLFSTIAFDNQR